MLVQWLALISVATSDSLHRAVCDGSQQSTHDCAFVSVAHGQFWAAPEFVFAPVAPLREILLPPSVHRTDAASEDLRLMPGRAPPAMLHAS